MTIYYIICKLAEHEVGIPECIDLVVGTRADADRALGLNRQLAGASYSLWLSTDEAWAEGWVE